MFEALREIELKILHALTCPIESPLADTVASYVNEVWPGVLLYLLTLLVLSLSAARRPRVLRVFLAGILALGAVHGVRAVVWKTLPRDRPGKLFTKAQTLEGVLNRGTCEQHPEMWVARAYGPESPSLPSSHTITAAAFAATLGFGFPWLAAPAWLYALLVGLGRLYWGKHWPSDILISLLLSLVVGWLAWRSIPRLQAWAGERLRRRHEIT